MTRAAPKWKPRYHMSDLQGHFDPTIQTGGTLLPAERFEHPNLTGEPDNITDTRADACMNTHIGKACAGLNPKYRASGSEVRRAIRSGVSPTRVRKSLLWGVPGMREDQVDFMIATSGLSIRDLAACFRRTFGDGACGYADHLNRWALDPDDPPERCEVWMHIPQEELMAGDAPEALFSIRSGDPEWEPHIPKGEVTITLGHIHYCLDPHMLSQAQENWHRRCGKIE